VLDQALDWLPLITLLALLPAAKLRALRMQRCGQRVIIVDWNRPLGQILYDTLLIVVALCWFFLLLAEAWPLPYNWLPGWLTKKFIDAPPAKIIGATLLLAAPILYAAALHSLGESWRMGIDCDQPGPLVADGVYAWSRNPIYAAFFLLIGGACLIHGRVIDVLVGAALILLIHGIALREERFLSGRFGEDFRAYRQRVGRYLPRWR
jgi:protein-S-isoprenylcysteine O-methyltransferase Ste14